ncbi:RIP metalloprotease RseP [Vibrio owensii]|uniref:RIP metalloprotease RseP n=1 Tax=Vibrio owensii TaxID=696485 RepID=UPI003CC5B168
MESSFLEHVTSLSSYLGAFILVMLIIVGIHEFGHFIVARACKIKVLEFSIGMGKKLLKYRSKSGTEYSLSVLPIGGYVKMLDEEEMTKKELEQFSASDLEHSFNRANKLQKLAVVAAGPFFNFICAIFFFACINTMGVTDLKPYVGSYQDSPLSKAIVEKHDDGFLSGDLLKSVDGEPVENWTDVFMQLTGKVGEPDVFSVVLIRDGKEKSVKLDFSDITLNKDSQDIVSTLGLIPAHLNYSNKVYKTTPDSALEKSGIKAGDTIEAIDQKDTVNFYQIADAVKLSDGSPMIFKITRNEETLEFTVTPKKMGEQYKIGFIPSLVKPSVPFEQHIYTHKYGVVEATSKAFEQSISATKLTYSFIKKLVVGDVSPSMISGPIGIAEIAGKSAEQGLTQFFRFIALISINIMIMNLLPIPALDGGHIAKYVVEMTIRRDINKKLESILYKIGVALLLSLMVFGIISDIIKLI